MEPTCSSDECALDPRVARSRAKMLAAATEILVESGARAVTVDAVAERSGVAKSTLYRHWDSRTDMLVAVLESNAPSIESPDLTAGFESALRSLLRQTAITFSDPEWACILPALFSLHQQIPEIETLTKSDHEAKIAALTEVLELGAEEGAIPAGLDPKLISMQLLGPLMLAVLSRSDLDLDELARHLVDRFVASYRA